MDPLLSDEVPGNAVGRCNTEAGYHGVICSSCLPGFKRSGTSSYECQACYKYELVWIIFVLALVIIGFTVMVKAVLASALAEENTQSVFGKILLNHLQMITITASFDMDWPFHVKYIFALVAPIKELTNAIVSFDCFMDRRNIEDVDPYRFYTDENDVRVVYQKLILYAGMPISLATIAWLVWYVIGRCNRWHKTPGMQEKHRTKFIATYVFLLFYVHPILTQSMIDMFNCQLYDGDLRLVVDLQVMCFEDPMHKLIAWYVALPCLICWGLGIPLGVFVLMRKDKDRLHTPLVRQKFGFLYNGYKPHNYFWEIVIMYRKITCIFIAVFLNRVGIIAQALVLIILLISFF